jgi:lipopolysaccharide export system permease protein
MAIPLSALIGSFVLVERMSRTHELTALRAQRNSLIQALVPIWVAALFLSAFNFAICSDLAPFCRRASKDLVYATTSRNPLYFLQRHAQKNLFVDFELNGKKVRDLTLIGYLNRHKRLSLFSASSLRIQGEELLGQRVALVSNMATAESYDSLVLENHAAMSISAVQLTHALRKNRVRQHDLNALNLAGLLSASSPKATLELFRRSSLSLSVITFTLLGTAFGLDERRRGPKRSLVLPLALTLMLLASYFLGKGFKANQEVVLLVMALPHLIAWIASALRLRQVNLGRR